MTGNSGYQDWFAVALSLPSHARGHLEGSKVKSRLRKVTLPVPILLQKAYHLGAAHPGKFFSVSDTRLSSHQPYNPKIIAHMVDVKAGLECVAAEAVPPHQFGDTAERRKSTVSGLRLTVRNICACVGCRYCCRLCY
jgi:hypothetical protein